MPNNSKKKGNKIKVFIGAVVLATVGGIALTQCSGCEVKDVETSYSNSDTDNKDNVATTTSATTTTTPKTTTAPFTTTTPKTTTSKTNTTSEPTIQEEIILDEVTPAIINVTAEDVIKLSQSYATYINKTATLSHRNYKFEEIKPEELYSVVYLANIDFVSKEETARLIANGIISDNIQNNVANSFYFYELYANDTINKISEGKTNTIDLSLLLVNEHDKEVAVTMNKIMTDSISANKETNYKNYMDTVYYYAEGVTIDNNTYDHSKSVYTSDRDKLSVGADYTLSYSASCIDEISKMNGVATEYYSQIMYKGRVDFSNVVSMFNGCKLPEQIENNNSKTLVK